MTSPQDVKNQVQDEIPPLTPEYYKARRQLILWSSILFAWELVGVDIEKLATTAGYVGAVAKALKSPQAVPWVIVVLVLYFAYRFMVEWNQSNYERRSRGVSRVDLYVSLGIACSSYMLFFGQLAAGVQFANILRNILTWRAGTGFLMFFSLGYLYYKFRVKISDKLTQTRLPRSDEIKGPAYKKHNEKIKSRAVAHGIVLVILGTCAFGLYAWSPYRSIGRGGIAGLVLCAHMFIVDLCNLWDIRNRLKNWASLSK